MNKIIKIDQMAKEIVEMAKQACPHCGAETFEERSSVEFLCGSLRYADGTFLLHRHCYERQIAAQAAEIERLKQTQTYAPLGWKCPTCAAVYSPTEGCCWKCSAPSSLRITCGV